LLAAVVTRPLFTDGLGGREAHRSPCGARWRSHGGFLRPPEEKAFAALGGCAGVVAEDLAAKATSSANASVVSSRRCSASASSGVRFTTPSVVSVARSAAEQCNAVSESPPVLAARRGTTGRAARAWRAARQETRWLWGAATASAPTGSALLVGNMTTLAVLQYVSALLRLPREGLRSRSHCLRALLRCVSRVLNGGSSALRWHKCAKSRGAIMFEARLTQGSLLKKVRLMPVCQRGGCTCAVRCRSSFPPTCKPHARGARSQPRPHVAHHSPMALTSCHAPRRRCWIASRSW
jgi:hypothetical protein